MSLKVLDDSRFAGWLSSFRGQLLAQERQEGNHEEQQDKLFHVRLLSRRALDDRVKSPAPPNREEADAACRHCRGYHTKLARMRTSFEKAKRKDWEA